MKYEDELQLEAYRELNRWNRHTNNVTSALDKILLPSTLIGVGAMYVHSDDNFLAFFVAGLAGMAVLTLWLRHTMRHHAWCIERWRVIKHIEDSKCIVGHNKVCTPHGKQNLWVRKAFFWSYVAGIILILLLRWRMRC